MKNKLISVIGLGYIGLPTAALLAGHNYNVVGTDINRDAVDAINQGKT
ncbi:MAG: UDP-N-acetyl-D-mannosamine dehydrogenase, partial [Paracoccaceae bacterium]